MTATSQGQDKGKADSESTKQTAAETASQEQKQPESQKADQGVPRGEHIEQRQELRQARDEIAELKKTLADLQKQRESQAPSTQDSNRQLEQTVKDLARRQQLRDIQSELGLESGKQAEAIAKLMDGMPTLSVAEAKSIAASRDPDLFAAQDRGSGYDPSIHGSMRPRPGDQSPEPKKSDYQQRVEAIGNVRKQNKHAADRIMNNLLGSMAAKAAGIQGHKLIDLNPDQ